MESKIKNAYNKLGKFYYESRKYKTAGTWFYNENLEMPATLELLGEINRKKILDLGCGPGFHTKYLIKRGAKVKGIDFSKELINFARKENPSVEFTICNAEKLPYKNNEFDFVLSSLVMGHVKNWDKVLKEVKRVLKSNGLFVFSIRNPISECSEKIKWHRRTFRVIRDYFNEKWMIEEWTDKKGNFATGAHHHKTYETIIRLLIKNNFEIISYKDSKPSIKMKKLFPKQYEETINRPHFCTWKVRKK